MLGGYQVECNQALAYVGKWAAFANAHKKLGDLPRKIDLKSTYFSMAFRFPQLCSLIVNVFGIKHDMDRTKKMLETTICPHILPNFLMFGSQMVKIVGPAFLPTLHKFCILLLCPCEVDMSKG